MYTWNDGTYLAHHGIKGQKWGLRRFQNEDGSLTPAGRERYSADQYRGFVKAVGTYNKMKYESGQQRLRNLKKYGDKYDDEMNEIEKNSHKYTKEEYDKRVNKAADDYDMQIRKEWKKDGIRQDLAKKALEQKYGFSMDEAQKALNNHPYRAFLAMQGSKTVDKILNAGLNKERHPFDERPSDNNVWTEKPSKSRGGNI